MPITVNQVDVCKCGRSYIHCPNCGKRGPYYKKIQSADLSVLYKREIKAYRCACGMEFTNETECGAPSKIISSVQQKDTMRPGSAEYLAAFNETAVELTKKKHITLVKAYVELVKQGWEISSYELDDDVKEALIIAGLSSSTEVMQAPVQEIQSEPKEPPIPLEEIIKNMQENSR